MYITMWGDHGGECSPFGVLPTLVAASEFAKGNFEKENITPEQEKSAAALCGMLMDKYGISEVCGHSHLFNTACPGKNFPLSRIISEAKIKAKEYK